MESLYPQIRNLLLQAGCRLIRQGKGSHEIWHSPTANKVFSVARTLSSKHMANAILKQAGLPKAF
jgi:predicted RNA binding protein YcfA (HicA-like mRNA interferase family)